MKKVLSLFLLLNISSEVISQTNEESQSRIPLIEAVNLLSIESGSKINFNPQWLDGLYLFDTLDYKLEVSQFLRAALNVNGLTFVQIDGEFYIIQSSKISPDLAKIIGANLSQSEFESSLLLDQIENYSSLKYYEITGIISNASSNESAIGANISIPKLNIATVTDVNGRFKMALPAGKHELVISSIGFETTTREIIVSSNENIDIQVFEKSVALDELVVFANSERETLDRAQSSLEIVNVESVKKLPTFMGELDVIKTITSLPGVSTVGEGAGGFNVRGGNVDENLILFDGIPIFNSSHLFGFFSVFNSEVIDNFELYKGGIPSNYGGRISSILNVNSKNGNTENLHYNGSIGLISSKLTIDGPINQKTTFLIGARQAYPTHMLKYFPDESIKESSASFKDYNLKFSHKTSSTSDLTLSSYFSNDKFSFAQDTLYEWSNIGVSLSWNKRLNTKSAFNLSSYISDYTNLIYGSSSNQEYNYETGVNQIGLNASFLHSINSDDFVETGVQISQYTVNSGQIAPSSSESAINSLKIGSESALESALYISREKKIFSKLSIQGGLRLSQFSNLGRGEDYVYSNRDYPLIREITDTIQHNGIHNNSIWLEPRFSMKYSLTNNIAFKVGYNYLRQNIHVISITSAVAPTDYWKLSDPNLPSTTGNQVNAGLQGLFKQYSISVESYYKTQSNILDYRDGGDIFLNPNVETALIFARGKSYGLEFKVEKSGRLNGWMSYTYSRTLRYNKTISDKWYPAQFDKPHNLSVNAIYKFRKRTSLAGNFIFTSGRAITVPTAGYYLNDQLVVLYSERNAARTPSYHRADISLTLDGNFKRRGFKSSWVFSIYNIYGRRNPYSIYFDTIAYGRYPQGYKLSILGNAFPSISYNFSIL